MKVNFDKKYLPSRKFVISLSVVFALLIIILVFRYAGNEKRETLVISNNQALDVQNIKDIKAIDSDNDGLPDWEETLWKTDPKNPDTDGDGTPDGEEITLGRDPLVANTAKKGQEPNDKINPSVIAANKADDAEWNKLNETDKFSRLLFSDFIATQPADGTPLTTDQTNQLVANAMTNLPDIQLEQKYVLGDMSIIENPTAKDIKNYTTNFINIFTNRIENNLFKELSIFNDYISKDDPKILLGIDKFITFYQKSANEIIGIKVPGEIASDQLELANSLYILSILAKDLEAMDTNPLISTIALKKYGEILQSSKQAVDNINLYLSKNF